MKTAPCPNCNCQDPQTFFKRFHDPRFGIGGQVACRICGMEGPEGMNEEEALHKWNCLPRSLPYGGMKFSQAERGTIFMRCLEAWGEKAQLGMVMEECAELIQAVNKFMRGKDSDMQALAGEVADVYNMLGQLSLIVGRDKIDTARQLKLERVLQRLPKVVP